MLASEQIKILGQNPRVLYTFRATGFPNYRERTVLSGFRAIFDHLYKTKNQSRAFHNFRITVILKCIKNFFRVIDSPL